MCNMLLFIFISFVSYLPLLTMETPAEEKTWTWEIFHLVDQWTDPLSYFTDPRAPKVCDDVMRFGLPTHDPKYREYTGDAQCLDDVKSALKRQRALITSLEAECLKDSGSKVELLRDAYDRQKEYFSQNVIALIESYLKRSTQVARNTALILDKQAGKTLDAPPIPTHLSGMQPIDETRAVTYKTIENLVMATPGIWGNTINYLRKTWTDPLKYLTDEKAQSISLAMRHLHPCHKFHTDQWQFNNQLEFHKRLIHQALERETKLTLALQYALEKKKDWMVVNINPENPDNQSVMINIASSYSPIVRAIIKGFLTSAANKKEREVREKEKKEQEQKELIEKSQQITPLIHSLRRKLSDTNNKEKLQSLTEAQRNIPIIAGNKLISNRGAGLAEVREAHQMLIEFETVVTQLLAATSLPSAPNQTIATPTVPAAGVSQTPPAQSTAIATLVPLVTPETKPAAKYPSKSDLSSIQTLVDTSHMAKPPTTAPLISTPPTQSFATSETSPPSLADELAHVSSQSSPQASPPRSPGGSLLGTPAASSTTEEDFNPRGKGQENTIVQPPSNPAQAKLAAAMTPPAVTPKQSQPKQTNKKRN